MTKQSIMLQLLTQIKQEFNIGEPRFPHLKLKVSDISPEQDAIELYIRAKDILWNSNLPQRQVADIILDLGAAVQLKDGKNILQEIVKLFSLY
ncbi:unknown [Azospirillum sp. CAG:239]|nr:unknown [Azospirillum sp. CAG:239]